MGNQTELTHSSTDWHRIGQGILKKGAVAVVAAGLISCVAFGAIKGASFFNKNQDAVQDDNKPAAVAPANPKNTNQNNRINPQSKPSVKIVEENGKVVAVVSEDSKQEKPEEKPEEKPSEDTNSKDSNLTPGIEEQNPPTSSGGATNDSSSQASDSSSSSEETSSVEQPTQAGSESTLNPTIKSIEAGEATAPEE